MGTVTIGTDTFDVLGTTAALATYANGSAAFYASYAAATSDGAKRAHVEATRLLVELTYADTVDAAPATAASDSAIARVCYELALAGLADVSVFTAASAADNTKRMVAKGVEIESFAPTKGARFPARVMTLLAPLLASSAASSSDVTSGGYLAGTDTASDFDTDDAYGVTA